MIDPDGLPDAITAADAARHFGIRASTVRAWASDGPATRAKGIEPKIYPVGTTRLGEKLFPTARIRELATTHKPRTPHARPTRSGCTVPRPDIASAP